MAVSELGPAETSRHDTAFGYLPGVTVALRSLAVRRAATVDGGPPGMRDLLRRPGLVRALVVSRARPDRREPDRHRCRGRPASAG